MITAMPRWPNNREALEVVEKDHLSTVMIAFLTWQSRYLPMRPRSVTIEQPVFSDPRWGKHIFGVCAIAEKARKGLDLTPHLSLHPKKVGVAPLARGPGSTMEERWADKDFMLTSTGFHHFHLGTRLHANGHVDRTHELLFAEVTRERFVAVALTDHGVFDQGSTERRRINMLCDARIAAMLAPDTAYMRAPIMTSGHRMHVVMYADRCVSTIDEFDPKLEDPDFVRKLYADAGREPPAKSKFRWRLMNLDFGVLDESTRVFFTFYKGWM